jgi:CheY-like chemotaxis protein
MTSSWILVVDDDADIRDVIVLLLGTLGYAAQAAADGEAAIEHLSGPDLPGLILLDLMMPRMNGEAFLRLLRADARLAAIPVVILSGNNVASETLNGLKLAGRLTKPIELEQLVALVERFIPSSQEA